jgi:CHAT domain-containing protein
MLKDLLFEDDPAQVLKSTMNSPSTSSSHNLNPIYTKEEKPGTITSTNAKMKEKKKPTEEVQEDFSTSNLTQEALKVLEEEEQIIISPIIQEIEKQQKQLETTNIDNIFLGSIVEFETWGQEEIEDFFP